MFQKENKGLPSTVTVGVGVARAAIVSAHVGSFLSLYNTKWDYQNPKLHKKINK